MFDHRDDVDESLPVAGRVRLLQVVFGEVQAGFPQFATQLEEDVGAPRLRAIQQNPNRVDLIFVLVDEPGAVR